MLIFVVKVSEYELFWMVYQTFVNYNNVLYMYFIL